MTSAVETMAYTGEVPWHTLGDSIVGLKSLKEWMTRAGLDWEVEMQELFLPDGRRAGKQCALVRKSDGKCLTFASESWKPLQNAQIVEFFRDYVEVGGATMETLGSLNGGRIVWGLARLKSFFKVGTRDVVNGYLLLMGSHEAGTAHHGRVTGIRVVCANTLAMALHGLANVQFSQSHRLEFDPEAAKAEIAIANEAMVQMGKDSNKLAKLKMSDSDVAAFLAGYIPAFKPTIRSETEKLLVADGRRKQVAKLLEDAETFANRQKAVAMLLDADNQSKVFREVWDSYQNAPGAVPGTGWGVLNAVTHWVDHKAGWSADNRLSQAWTGSRGRLKEQVNRGLLQLAA